MSVDIVSKNVPCLVLITIAFIIHYCLQPAHVQIAGTFVCYVCQCQCFNNISAAVRQPQTAKPRVAKQPHPVAGQGEATKGPEQRHSATLCRNSWLPPQWPLYEVGVVANSNKNPVSCHPVNNLTSYIFLGGNAQKL